MSLKNNFERAQFPLTLSLSPMGRGQGEGIKGQATFEYFVLFVLLGFFCLFSLNRQQNIKNTVQRSAQDIFQRGVVEIVKMR